MKRTVLFIAGAWLLGAAQAGAQTFGERLRSVGEQLQAAGTLVADHLAHLKGLDHLDIGVTTGTTGLGIDAQMPVGDYTQIRAGVSFMPRFSHDMHFGVESTGSGDGNSQARFQQLAEKMPMINQFDIDDNVKMVGKPTYWNVKLLADVYPFRNKHWHVTAGFYWGPSTIATAENATEDAPTLVAVQMYNNMYDVITAVPYQPFEYFNDFYMDRELQNALKERFNRYGRVGIHVGNYRHEVTTVNEEGETVVVHQQGDPYMMVPDESAMVKAKVKVNAFKPYLGFGYGGRLAKGDDRYRLSVDCGMMFWGGTPRVETHDGTDLANDVEDIGGKVGRYVSTIKAFKVFPMVELRLTRRIF